VGRITPAGQPPVEFTYEGERVKTRKVKVMMASGEDMAATWSGTCRGIETSYLYDVGGSLTRVCLDREGQACGQIRRFLYDHRGFNGPTCSAVRRDRSGPGPSRSAAP